MKTAINRTKPTIIDKGGPVLTNGKVQLIFWGDWNNSSLAPFKEAIANAIQNIIDSEYYSKLSQYRGIQKPTYLGSVVNDTSRIPRIFKYSAISKAIGDSIQNGSVPDFRSFTNGQIMYIVIPTPDHQSTDTVGNAFHDNFEYKGNDNGVYAVCSWRNNKDRDLEWITRAFAHEIAEMCTNPGYDDAFVDPNVDSDDNEIADFCEDVFGEVNGQIVEGYWSNLDGGCIIPGKK
jgi:hypothetical protein